MKKLTKIGAALSLAFVNTFATCLIRASAMPPDFKNSNVNTKSNCSENKKLWSQEEIKKFQSLIEKNTDSKGNINWPAVQSFFPNRSLKSLQHMHQKSWSDQEIEKLKKYIKNNKNSEGKIDWSKIQTVLPNKPLEYIEKQQQKLWFDEEREFLKKYINKYIDENKEITWLNDQDMSELLKKLDDKKIDVVKNFANTPLEPKKNPSNSINSYETSTNESILDNLKKLNDKISEETNASSDKDLIQGLSTLKLKSTLTDSEKTLLKQLLLKDPINLKTCSMELRKNKINEISKIFGKNEAQIMLAIQEINKQDSKINFENENLYSESIVDGKLRGKGCTAKSPSDLEINVYFEQEQLLNGSIKPSNNDFCEGTFIDGKLEGPNCKKISSYGLIEEGEFKQGILIAGKRTYKAINSETLKYNSFNEKKLTNYIMETTNNYETNSLSSVAQEEGFFKEGKLEKGKVVFSNGNSYEGYLYYGYLDGEDCKITFANGATVKGYFEKGYFISGSIKSSNEVAYIGRFEKGKLMGNHCVKIQNNCIEEGEFTEGKLCNGSKTFLSAAPNNCFNTMTISVVLYKDGYKDFAEYGRFSHLQDLLQHLSIKDFQINQIMDIDMTIHIKEINFFKDLLLV